MLLSSGLDVAHISFAKHVIEREKTHYIIIIIIIIHMYFGLFLET